MVWTESGLHFVIPCCSNHVYEQLFRWWTTQDANADGAAEQEQAQQTLRLF